MKAFTLCCTRHAASLKLLDQEERRGWLQNNGVRGILRGWTWRIKKRHRNKTEKIQKQKVTAIAIVIDQNQESKVHLARLFVQCRLQLPSAQVLTRRFTREILSKGGRLYRYAAVFNQNFIGVGLEAGVLHTRENTAGLGFNL
jgi:hypothetical protein